MQSTLKLALQTVHELVHAFFTDHYGTCHVELMTAVHAPLPHLHAEHLPAKDGHDWDNWLVIEWEGRKIYLCPYLSNADVPATATQLTYRASGPVKDWSCEVTYSELYDHLRAFFKRKATQEQTLLDHLRLRMLELQVPKRLGYDIVDEVLLEAQRTYDLDPHHAVTSIHPVHLQFLEGRAACMTLQRLDGTGAEVLRQLAKQHQQLLLGEL